MPRSTLTRLNARAIAASAACTIARAARSGVTPSASASRPTAACAALASSATTPSVRAVSVPSTICASVTVASVPPRPNAAGPGVAPALRGPTRNAPPSSTQPMLPPPADTDSTSTRGSAIGTPRRLRHSP